MANEGYSPVITKDKKKHVAILGFRGGVGEIIGRSFRFVSDSRYIYIYILYVLLTLCLPSM